MIENLDAERAVLAAAIMSRQGRNILGRLTSGDFCDTRHRVIASVITDMTNHDMPVDELTIVDELRNRGKLSTPGGAGGLMYVVGLTTNVNVVAASAEYYADQVRLAARLRVTRDVGRTMANRAELEGAGEEIEGLLRASRESLDSIPGPLVVQDDDSMDTLQQIMSEQDAPDEWLIPGLLTREERVVFVAGEGVGKTSLLRQIAVCAAGGLNPWSGQRVADGLRVLFIDPENSRNQSRRAYRWVSGKCVRPLIARDWKSRIIHKTRNDGVDLASADASWFREVADRTSPDLIILGSAYKLMRGDPQKDVDVMALLNIIDKVRVEHRCAVMIETHSPGGSAGASREMRPYGSSVWRRWPEVGVGYYRDESEGVVQYPTPRNLQMVEWRGAREPRDWPPFIEHGGPSEMPWVPVGGFTSSVDLGYVADDESEGRAA